MAILVSDITARVRMKMADVSGEQWDDATLCPFVQEAYEEAQRFLRGKGMLLFLKESGVIAVASGTTTITRTGGTTYPADLVRPMEVRWRVAGSGTWVTPPLRLNDGFFPDAAVDASLRLYDWRNDTLLLGKGANVNTEIQIQYDADFPVVDDPSDEIKIPNSIGPIALLAASSAAESLDETEHAVRWEEQGHKQLEYIALAEQLARRAASARFGGQ